MNNKVSRINVKILSLVLVYTFMCMDLAWAGPDFSLSNNACLSAALQIDTLQLQKAVKSAIADHAEGTLTFPEIKILPNKTLALQLQEMGKGLTAINEESSKTHSDQLVIDASMIDAFVRGKMNKSDRALFARRLKNNQTLRNKVQEHRMTLAKNKISISSQARDLLNKGLKSFRKGNDLFPGDPYIMGNEKRPSNIANRERFYREAIAFFEQLIELGELEDIAHENIFRINENIVIAKVKLGDFNEPPKYVETMIANINLARELNNVGDGSVEGRHEPLEPQFKGDIVSTKSVTNVSMSFIIQLSAIKTFLFFNRQKLGYIPAEKRLRYNKNQETLCLDLSYGSIDYDGTDLQDMMAKVTFEKLEMLAFLTNTTELEISYRNLDNDQIKKFLPHMFRLQQLDLTGNEYIDEISCLFHSHNLTNVGFTGTRVPKKQIIALFAHLQSREHLTVIDANDNRIEYEDIKKEQAFLWYQDKYPHLFEKKQTAEILPATSSPHKPIPETRNSLPEITYGEVPLVQDLLLEEIVNMLFRHNDNFDGKEELLNDPQRMLEFAKEAREICGQMPLEKFKKQITSNVIGVFMVLPVRLQNTFCPVVRLKNEHNNRLLRYVAQSI